MTILLTLIHIVVSLILILVVLLQTGKRADLAGAFGGGGSQTAFGTRGAATFLSKATTIAAVVFMVTSLGLSIDSSRPGGGTSTVLDEVESAPLPMAPSDEERRQRDEESLTPDQVPAPGNAPAGGAQQQPAQQPQGQTP